MNYQVSFVPLVKGYHQFFNEEKMKVDIWTHYKMGLLTKCGLSF